jgi:D-alanyl-lipoteichoic acid acyltransferase DltB (MBOAT superfamily)
LLFNTYVFLLAFLPLTLAGYAVLTRLAPRRVAIGWLAVASLVFYGWWHPAYLLLLGASVAANFALGRSLSRLAGTGRGRALLASGIALNLGLLGYFKYAGFLVTTAAGLTGAGWDIGAIVLPIGISFFTFQQIAYLVDAFRREASEYHLVDYTLFVTFFPQLIAGPIVHHKDVSPQFERRYRFSPRDLSVGVTIFVLGLAKKVCLADELAVFATPMFATADAGLAVPAAAAWLGTLAYAFQLYFDFSGYSDMAIGLGRMFGIRLPANFDSPYKATSIVDFWRRWHMTLSRFLRDYLYIPLGGGRRGAPRRYANLMITMMLGGLWHGAGWNFVLWGGLHGLYLCVARAWGRVREKLGWSPAVATSWGRPLAVVVTLFAVVLAWVPFRAETFAGTSRVLAGLAGGSAAPIVDLDVGEGVRWVIAGLLLVWLCPNTQELLERVRPVLQPRPLATWSLVRWRWRPTRRWAAAVAVLAWICLLQLSRLSEFLYYQF